MNGKEATQLMGVPFTFEDLAKAPGAWALTLFSNLSGDEPNIENAARFLTPDHIPDRFRGHFDATNLPDPTTAAKLIRGIVSEEIERLEAALTGLDSAPSDPSRGEALDLSLILHDGPSARFFLRYHSEARTSFHRAYGELVKTLARDAEELAEAEEISSNDVAQGPSPNEATSAAEPSESPDDATTSDPSPAPPPAPASSPERVETSATDQPSRRPFRVVFDRRMRRSPTPPERPNRPIARADGAGPGGFPAENRLRRPRHAAGS